jgi:hypothetical protein
MATRRYGAVHFPSQLIAYAFPYAFLYRQNERIKIQDDTAASGWNGRGGDFKGDGEAARIWV